MYSYCRVSVDVMSAGRVWQGRNADFETEVSKLQEKEAKLEEDKKKISEQYKQEYMDLKTERDGVISQLKGI